MRPSVRCSGRRTMLGLWLGISTPLVQAQIGEPPQLPLKTLSLEQLAEIEVTSVGRKEQLALTSPAALAVITQDDIRRLGARSIPEILRLVNGLEVARFNNTSYPISARGFNTTSAN